MAVVVSVSPFLFYMSVCTCLFLSIFKISTLYRDAERSYGQNWQCFTILEGRVSIKRVRRFYLLVMHVWFYVIIVGSLTVSSFEKKKNL